MHWERLFQCSTLLTWLMRITLSRKYNGKHFKMAETFEYRLLQLTHSGNQSRNITSLLLHQAFKCYDHIFLFQLEFDWLQTRYYSIEHSVISSHFHPMVLMHAENECRFRDCSSYVRPNLFIEIFNTTFSLFWGFFNAFMRQWQCTAVI